MANDGGRDRSTKGRDDAEDPGAYIGHEPERATETIPGGLSRKDKRVSAVDTQPSGGERREEWPGGHRQGERANDDRVREAGDRD
jgi:hypothetical protein